MLCHLALKELWLCTDKDADSVKVNSSSELCGFGSGDWAQGGEATDVMSDTSPTGRWLPFLIRSLHDTCIVEMDKRLPDNLKKVDIYNKAGRPYFPLYLVPSK